MPYALFVNGNSSYNIRNGSAMLNDKAIQITKAVFGNGTKDEDKLGKGVSRQYGKGDEGFNISSCQFAIHYFFESIETLQGFLRNVAECTKLGGYFIGTCYDGKLIFNLLRKKIFGESVQIQENGKKIWEVIKRYEEENYDDDISCVGYKIDVFQESINQTISEYLVNFDYLNRIMEDYGFKIIDRNEAQTLGISEGTGLFSDLYMKMMEEVKRNKHKFRESNEYGKSENMNAFEKKISFLNRYFIYKKIRNVNAEKVKLDLDVDIELKENNSKIINSKQKETSKKEKNVKVSPQKIKKLDKKLILVPATESLEVPKPEPVINIKEPELELELKPEKELLQEAVQEIDIIKESEQLTQEETKKIAEEKKKRKPRSDIGTKRDKSKKPLIIIEE